MSIATSLVSAASRAWPGQGAGRLLILIYHRVRPVADPMYPNEVTERTFDWQMELLRQHCAPVELSKAVALLGQDRLPARAVAVTFDDGYADNVSVALPILIRHRVPATFFIASAFLNHGRMWNDSIIEAVRRATLKSLDLTDLGLGTWSLGPEPSRGPVAEGILRAVKHANPTERQHLVDSICDRIGQPLPDDLMMTVTQIRMLAEAGMEIGAHTVSHPILRTLSDAAAEKEIVDSRRALEEMIDRPVTAFAYPNGKPGDDYVERDRSIVARQGFAYAVSTVRGAVTKQSDLYQLPRFAPWGRSPASWLARLLDGFRV